MADLGLNASQLTSIIGIDSTGGETYPVGSTSDNRLKVDAVNYTSKKLRFDYIGVDVSFGIGGAYTALYNYNGQGELYSFFTQTNDNKVQFKLVVDGEEIFKDISNEVLVDLALDPGVSTISDFLFRNTTNHTAFKLPAPMRYNSSVQLFAKKSDNNAGTLKNLLIILTKE